MKFRMYSVKDELTGKFMQPMYVDETEDIALCDQLAIRQFKTQVNNIQLWKDNSNDYSLFFVGRFDDEGGAEAVALEKITSGRSVLDASTK